MYEGQFVDKTIVCRDCGREFVHTAAEQEFFRQKGFMNDPKRCMECRRRRKAQRSQGPGRPADRRAPPGRFSPPPPPTRSPVAVPVGPSEDADSEEAKVAICGSCGRETQLANVPSPLRPVYCRECYDKWRAENSGRETS